MKYMNIPSKRRKVVAINFLLLFVFELISPGILAIPGGPNSPEYASFAPMGMSQMVDPFTGDFSYNIPLMEIPGPNGSFPINLHYRAGISMEEEASWVGLGWHLNVGAINRQVSGLPDDLSGEPVKRTRYKRPSWTTSVDGTFINEQNDYTSNLIPFKGEIYGWEDLNTTTVTQTARVALNNYSGIGLSHSFSKSESNSRYYAQSKTRSSLGTYNLGSIGVSSESGSISVDRTFMGKFFGATDQYKSSAYRNWSINLKDPSNIGIALNGGKWLNSLNQAAMLSANQPTLSAASFPQRTTSTGFELSIWKVNSLGGGDWEETNTSINGSFISQYVPIGARTIEYRGYGFLHSDVQHGPSISANYPWENGEEPVLTDWALENEHPMTKRTPNLPLPIQSNDSWVVNGHGISGSFRAFRNDPVHYSKPAAEFDLVSGNGGAEIGNPEALLQNNIKVGVDLSGTAGADYAGHWRSGMAALNLDALGAPSVSEESEDFYFQMIDENTVAKSNHLDYVGGDSPIAYKLGWQVADGSEFGTFPSTKAKLTGQTVTGHQIDGSYTERTPRQTSIQYRSFEEINQQSDVSVTWANRNITDVNDNAVSQPQYEHQNQIGEFECITTEGMRYVYGLPVREKEKVNCSFRIDEVSNWGDRNVDLSSYLKDLEQNEDISDLTDNEVLLYEPDNIGSMGDPGGIDHFYSKDELPEHVSTYLLTEMYSQDYVDLTGDGPSEDDLGYWIRINYLKMDDFHWRQPYAGAYYDPGDDSNDLDGMMSYSYGVREAYYVKSIESKTHIAVFETSARDDNQPVPTNINPEHNQEENVGLAESVRSRKLDRIKLYAKSDDGLQSDYLLQTIDLSYNYSLCVGAPNALDSGTGKLTLTDLQITYEDSDKGAGSKYQFAYGDFNPSYAPRDMDRWGTCTPNHDRFNPYTDQTLSQQALNERASAWCLDEISLPSGASILVDYEADDYQYVQDHKAQAMTKIVGTYALSGNPSLTDIQEGKVGKHDRRIYFELPSGVGIGDYNLSVGDDTYFKAFTKLKNTLGLNPEMATEYVEGWAKIQDWGQATVSGVTYGYVDFEAVSADGLGLTSCNPIQLAAWEDIRTSRSYLMTGQTDEEVTIDDVVDVAFDIMNIFAQSAQMFISYYGYAKIQHWGEYLDLSSGANPSFIRLPDPDGRKIGGGHRVSRVRLVDNNWTEDDAIVGEDYSIIYGQNYSYDLEDGTSSGVASNEPALGEEESALLNPIYFNDTNVPVSLRSATSFTEEPLGRSYFPAASVGYSRVVVDTDVHQLNGYSDHLSNGITQQEFYTSKDFPTLVRKTFIKPSNDTFKSKYIPIPIPGVGIQTFQSQGYSQGFVVELNDMHGKPKATAVYSSSNVSEEPVTRTEYAYLQDELNPKKLANKVQVLNELGVVSERTLGVKYDFFLFSEEQSSWSEKLGGNTGLNGNPPMLIPSGQPDMDYSQSNYRAIATTKVIYRNGVLKNVRTFADGSSTTAENLVYDRLSGEPILTTTQNEWNEPVYTLDYRGHHYYDILKGAYNNYRANIGFVTDEDGYLTSELEALLGTRLFLGDMIYVDGDMYWLHEVADGLVTKYMLLKENVILSSLQAGDYFLNPPNQGQPAAPINGVVYNSGASNLQSTSVGQIVTLSHPLGGGMFDQVVNAYNASMAGQYMLCGDDKLPDELQGWDSPTHLCVNCGDANPKILRYDNFSGDNLAGFTSDDLVIQFGGLYPSDLSSECRTIQLVFEGSYSWLTDGATLSQDGFQFYLTNQSSGEVAALEITDVHRTWFDCVLGRCLDVLHAQASSISDIWDDSYELYASQNTALENGLNLQQQVNQYRYGKRGVPRMNRTFVYETGRVQSSDPEIDKTRIDTDGLYEEFVEFDWKASDELLDNPTWTWASKMNYYSPYGYAVDTRDALEIHSAALYAHKYSVQSAQAANAKIQEIGFDSFEDHGASYDLTSNHGNLLFDNSTTVLSQAEHHTGDHALFVTDQTDVKCDTDQELTDHFSPLLSSGTNNEYYVSCWFKKENADEVKIRFIDPSQNIVEVSSEDVQMEEIDGWVRLTAKHKFTVSGSHKIELKGYTNVGGVLTEGGSFYLDDFRIMPSDAAMSTYVYDPSTFRLRAVLDDNNFATFYSYDQEGQLVQTSIETIDGRRTISTGRSNTYQQ